MVSNPLALATNTLRQAGEQGNRLIQQLSNQLTTVSSGLLRNLGTGLPPLPGLGGRGSTHNGGFPGIPALGNLAQPILQSAMQVESSLPGGGLGIARTIMGTIRGIPIAMNGINGGNEVVVPTATPAAPGNVPRGGGVGIEGINGSGSRRAKGVQLS